jgi:galactokinase
MPIAANMYFERVFQREVQGQVFAPGRINLIGEHIDYSGGSVLPVPIQFGTRCNYAKNNSGKLRVASTRYPDPVEQGLDALTFCDESGWANYPVGVVKHYRQRGLVISGIDLLFDGDIPGGGLSSSASLTVATAIALEQAYGFSLAAEWSASRWLMAELCQQVENNFIGVGCGIMDPAAIALASGVNALKIDCGTSISSMVPVEYIPFDVHPYCLVIMDTRKQRQLLNSVYNQRVEEVSRILGVLREKGMPVRDLCSIRPAELSKITELLSDDRLYRRCKHIVLENARVVDAADALVDGKLLEFGKLMIESHYSLQHDYEVSCAELDFLVETSIHLDGVAGARMTGAGFGGCAIALVHSEMVSQHMELVGIDYKDRFKQTAGFHVVDINQDSFSADGKPASITDILPD